MKTHERMVGLAGITAVCLGLAWPVESVAKTTAATNSGDWATATIWDNGAPAAGDTVTINSGKSVTLSAASGNFASFTVNGTLTFTNWDTSLSATMVTIASGGLVTLPAAFTTSQMSNRVYFICTDFTLASNATINVDYKGWSGGLGIGTNGYGPGGAPVTGTECSGAGHGGSGGKSGDGYAVGVTNDTISAPVLPGSGAGGTAHGGGVIYISAAGQVLVNGTMTAMGAVGGGLSPNNIGGGAGGSIYITCETFVSTTGVIRASGGAGSNYGGGGGGGCIAIVCNNLSAQQALPRMTASISCSGGSPGGSGGLWTYPGPGTVYANCENVLPVAWAGGASFFGFVAFSPSSLSISNATLTFTERPAVQVANDLSVVANGKLALYDANLTVGGNMLVSNANVYAYRGTNLAVRPSLSVAGNLTLAGTTTNTAFYVYAGTTNNGAGTNYDVSVSVGGTLSLVTNAWVYPISDSANGGSIKFSAKNVTLAATNTGFMADGRGWRGGGIGTNGFGPGGGNSAAGGAGGGGGGYGGRGSPGGWTTPIVWGATYGVSNAPVYPGSGGGGGGGGSYLGNGGAGGGLVWIDAPAGTISIQGVMTANGVQGGGGNNGGSGSGGGIYLTCKTISGSTSAKLLANGAPQPAAWGAPGGGGRIAVAAMNTNGFLGTVSASGAVGTVGGGKTNSEDGTIVWTLVPPKGMSVFLQ